MAFLYKCESIFDHNPTAKELTTLGMESADEIDFAKKCRAEATKVHWRQLCFLFDMRGQKEKVDEYFEKARKDGFDDLFTLGHELAGGCIQHV
ncbi:hypothetical protein [Desulfobacter vibrioformis]|uniref:hypothetical protein n=1 Tax=Desulfobacter vibrioformis TaxID=34031 RepID=UPI0005527C1B|nr:hypothetical protein [Desulfobacter vibrioformis]